MIVFILVYNLILFVYFLYVLYARSIIFLFFENNIISQLFTKTFFCFYLRPTMYKAWFDSWLTLLRCVSIAATAGMGKGTDRDRPEKQKNHSFSYAVEGENSHLQGVVLLSSQMKQDLDAFSGLAISRPTLSVVRLSALDIVFRAITNSKISRSVLFFLFIFLFFSLSYFFFSFRGLL